MTFLCCPLHVDATNGLVIANADRKMKVGEGHGVSAAQVALAWIASRPAVANIIVGARTEEQLKDNLAAASLKLTAEDLAALEEASFVPLEYPYWHQCASASNRLGEADLTLHAPHMARSKPIW